MKSAWLHIFFTLNQCSLIVKSVFDCRLPGVLLSSSGDPEGGTGVRTPPPGKSQGIWVSIGNKQLDPPPGKSWTPLEDIGLPLEP